MVGDPEGEIIRGGSASEKSGPGSLLSAKLRDAWTTMRKDTRAVVVKRSGEWRRHFKAGPCRTFLLVSLRFFRTPRLSTKFKKNFKVGGVEITNYRTDLPVKKGLSSSAAICVLLPRNIYALAPPAVLFCSCSLPYLVWCVHK